MIPVMQWISETPARAVTTFIFFAMILAFTVDIAKAIRGKS